MPDCQGWKKNLKIQYHKFHRKINNPFSASLGKAQWNEYNKTHLPTEQSVTFDGI